MDDLLTEKGYKVLMGMAAAYAVILVVLIVLSIRVEMIKRNAAPGPYEWMRTISAVKGFEPEYHEPYTGWYFCGGGCVDGIVPEESIPKNVNENDLLFFGERSLSSLAEGECYIVFNKLVMDLLTVETRMNDCVDRDIGVSLLVSYEAGVADDLKHLGLDPATVELVSSSVGLRPYEPDDRFGDIYGWYVIEASKKDGSGTERMEGYAVLHCRSYGFSAENYLGL